MSGFPINVLGIKTENREKKERIQGDPSSGAATPSSFNFNIIFTM